MSSTQTWEHFKTIYDHPIRNENIDIYILKENDKNVIRFEIICENRDNKSPNGFTYIETKTINKGTIIYDQYNNSFGCIFKKHETPYLPYDIKDEMKSAISELFLNKFNSESSIEMTFPKC